MDKEFHSLAQTRKYIQKASLIYGSISVVVESEQGEVEEQALVRITKKQAREIIRVTTESGCKVFCCLDDSRVMWI